MLVFWRVGSVVVVVADRECVKVGDVLLTELFNPYFWCDSSFFGTNHGRGTVSVFSTDEVTFVASQFLEANPNVRLDVLEQVS